MNKPSIRTALVACACALALAGCGGGRDGGGGGGDAVAGSDIPASALRSVQGLVDFMEDVIATMTGNTTEPLALGDVRLPTSETSEPL